MFGADRSWQILRDHNEAAETHNEGTMKTYLHTRNSAIDPYEAV